MQMIDEQEELVEFLFQELDESKPEQEVDPSFLLRVGGICQGLIWGGCEGAPPYLPDLLAIHWRDDAVTQCGTKLVAFVELLAAENCFDPNQRWTIPRMIALMLAALDTKGLQICDNPKGRVVVSTRKWETRRGVQVRVPLAEQ
jgi:hypothetical protein